MRCWRRSTTLRGSALVLVALALALPAAAGAADEADVRAAIEAAVRRQVGERATVAVRDLRIRLRPGTEGSLFVSLPADARGGVPMRVVVKSVRADGRGARFGDADCTVDVTLPGARMRRPVARGSTLSADDVEIADVSAEGGLLKPLPVDVDGARAAVDLPAGQVLQRSMLVAGPLVRSGDDVVITVRAGALQVQTRGVAAQPGSLGQLIRVVTADSGRRLSARVVGRGAVEVQHGS